MFRTLGAELIGAQPAKLANQSLVTKYTTSPRDRRVIRRQLNKSLYPQALFGGHGTPCTPGIPGGIQWGLYQGSSALTRAQAEHRLIPLGFLNELSPATPRGAKAPTWVALLPRLIGQGGGYFKELDFPPNKFTAAPRNSFRPLPPPWVPGSHLASDFTYRPKSGFT